MRLIFTLFFVLLISVSHGQNLVPNGSFEEHTGCPREFSEVNNLESWFRVNGTPDFYHLCGTAGFGIPSLWYGYQYSNSAIDSGFCGFLIQKNYSWREILAVKLISTLEVGRKYFLSFLYSPTLEGNQITCFANTFGVKLLTYRPTISTTSDLNLIDNKSIYKVSEVYTDTSSWIPINTSFIADSTYQYLAIGYFYEDSLINFQCNNGLGAYQFIDDVCLTLDSGSCRQLIFQNNLYDVQFISSKSELLFSSNSLKKELKIYNSIGQIVRKEFLVTSNYFIDLTDGVYFVFVENKFSLKILVIH